MSAPITRILLCLALCLMLFSSWGCPSDACVEYQYLAEVNVNSDSNIDSVAMIANDSVIGCRYYWYDSKVIGSKTHRVKFPINVRIQLFSQGGLWKEFFVEMDKNTKLSIFTGYGCSHPSGSGHNSFSQLLELAREQNRFIDLSFTDDYCWLLEKMVDSHDDMHCTKLSVGGEQELCRDNRYGYGKNQQ